MSKIEPGTLIKTEEEEEEEGHTPTKHQECDHQDSNSEEAESVDTEKTPSAPKPIPSKKRIDFLISRRITQENAEEDEKEEENERNFVTNKKQEEEKAHSGHYEEVVCAIIPEEEEDQDHHVMCQFKKMIERCKALLIATDDGQFINNKQNIIALSTVIEEMRKENETIQAQIQALEEALSKAVQVSHSSFVSIKKPATAEHQQPPSTTFHSTRKFLRF